MAEIIPEAIKVISRGEENLLMGVKAQEQYLLGAFLGVIYEVPLRYVLSFGRNTIIIRLIAQAMSMILNSMGIVLAIRLYEGSPYTMKLIPFQMGLLCMQPSLAENSIAIVNEVISLVKEIVPMSGVPSETEEG